MVRLFNGIHLHSIDSHCAIWKNEWNTRTEFHRYFHIFYAGMKSSFIPLKWGGGGICVHSYEIKWFYKTAPNSDASPHELITIVNQANRELKILLFPLIQPSSMWLLNYSNFRFHIVSNNSLDCVLYNSMCGSFDFIYWA